jgi:hypothetical protein
MIRFFFRHSNSLLKSFYFKYKFFNIINLGINLYLLNLYLLNLYLLNLYLLN